MLLGIASSLQYCAYYNVVPRGSYSIIMVSDIGHTTKLVEYNIIQSNILLEQSANRLCINLPYRGKVCCKMLLSNLYVAIATT